MGIQPLDDRVLVKPIEPEQKTATGIYLPEGAKEKPQKGKVISIGPGKMRDSGARTPVGVKKGDTVIYGKYAGSEIEIKGTKHLIMRGEDLLGLIEK